MLRSVSTPREQIVLPDAAPGLQQVAGDAVAGQFPAGQVAQPERRGEAGHHQVRALRVHRFGRGIQPRQQRYAAIMAVADVQVVIDVRHADQSLSGAQRQQQIGGVLVEGEDALRWVIEAPGLGAVAVVLCGGRRRGKHEREQQRPL